MGPISGPARMSPGRGLPPAPGDRRFPCSPPSGIRPLGPGLACCQGDGLGCLDGSCVQGAEGWIVSEGDLALAQVPDHIFGAGLVPGVDAAAGAPSATEGSPHRCNMSPATAKIAGTARLARMNHNVTAHEHPQGAEGAPAGGRAAPLDARS
jgi:hypothetical protein